MVSISVLHAYPSAFVDSPVSPGAGRLQAPPFCSALGKSEPLSKARVGRAQQVQAGLLL